VAGNRFEFELDNGNKFYIRRYDPFLSLEVLGEVQRKFLPPLAALMEANDTNTEQKDRIDNAMKAVEMVSRTLDGKSLIALVKVVLNPEYVSVSIQADPPIRLDEGALNRACDDVFEVIKLVIEVLRYNYERLFTQGRSLIGQVQQPPTIQ
jgi:hypothetical protein